MQALRCGIGAVVVPRPAYVALFTTATLKRSTRRLRRRECVPYYSCTVQLYGVQLYSCTSVLVTSLYVCTRGEAAHDA